MIRGMKARADTVFTLLLFAKQRSDQVGQLKISKLQFKVPVGMSTNFNLGYGIIIYFCN